MSFQTKGYMLLIKLLCFPCPFANTLTSFLSSFLPLPLSWFSLSIYTCLHIKRGRLAIRVQIPLTLLDLSYSLCQGRGRRSTFFFFQGFLSVCIIAVFLYNRDKAPLHLELMLFPQSQVRHKEHHWMGNNECHIIST